MTQQEDAMMRPRGGLGWGDTGRVKDYPDFWCQAWLAEIQGSSGSSGEEEG